MDKTMRVAQIMGKMEKGGVEAVVMNYYRHIDRNRIQFDFIVDNDSSIPQRQEIESMGGRVIEITPYQHISRYISELTEILKKNGYKIAHSHLNTLSVFPLYAAKKAGVPVRIAHNHSTAGKGETKKNIMKYMLRPFAKLNATHYAACSQYAGEWLFGKRAMKKGEVTIFNNAIDVDKFRYNETVRKEVRKELNIEGKFVIGHIGRFCYAKNHEFLIKIFNEIHKKEPNAVLLLAGAGELEDEVKKQVREYGIEDYVMMLGNRDDCERLYQAMDVFIFPSRYEGLGIVAIEAQVSGLPVLASKEVPDTIEITNNVQRLELSDGVRCWSDKAIELWEMNKRRNSFDVDAANMGYDINKENKKLADYYQHSLNSGGVSGDTSSEIQLGSQKLVKRIL